MFGIEQISRRCLMTFSDGSKIQATIYITKPTKPIFPEQMERNIIENFNKSQPLAVNKVVKCTILRNSYCWRLSTFQIMLYLQVTISKLDELARIEPLLTSACVPQCVYRGFCPDPKSCGRTKSNIFSVIRKYYKNLETY